MGRVIPVKNSLNTEIRRKPHSIILIRMLINYAEISMKIKLKFLNEFHFIRFPFKFSFTFLIFKVKYFTPSKLNKHNNELIAEICIKAIQPCVFVGVSEF